MKIIKILKLSSLLILFLICGYTPLLSAPITIDKTLTEISVGLNSEYLEDKDGSLNINDIQNKKYEDKWTASKKKNPGFGFTKSVYWLRFTVENTLDEDIKFYLQQAYPLIDDLKLYIPENNNFRTIEAGDLKPFNERPYEHRTFIFPLKLKAKSSATYYIRQNTASSMNFVISIWDPVKFQKETSTEYNFLMLFYGIILVMCLYNLFVFFFIRHIAYLYFSLSNLFLLLFLMMQNGTSFQYLWPGSPWWANFSIPLCLSIFLTAGNLFVMKILNTKKTLNFFHKVILIIFTGCIIVAVLSIFLPYGPAMIASAVLAVATASNSLLVGIILAVKKYRPAYFFSAAFLFFCFGAVSYGLMTFGIFEATFLTKWSMQIGLAALVILFSLALADRINIMRRELKVLNEDLEVKVEDRTQELNAAMEELEAINISLIDTRDALWGEMQIAQKIQTVLLPKKPEMDGFEISAYSQPADEVGGDYYDIINVDNKDWVIIGDVSGHGIPAGLIMMMVQTSIHTVLTKFPDSSPRELLETVNSVIYNNVQMLGEDSKYMTITVLAYHDSGKFNFSGLHQDIMVHRDKSKRIELVETDGMWIGILNDISDKLSEDSFVLEKGDTMLLFTDGITEAWRKGTVKDYRDAEFDMFGEERLEKAFLENAEKPTKDIIGNIISAVENYDYGDDVTMVVLRRLSQ